MMKDAGHFNAGFPEHANFLSEIPSLGNLYFYGPPLSSVWIAGLAFEKLIDTRAQKA
jgi:hypothetical protein